MNALTLLGYGAVTGVAATLLMDVSHVLWGALGIRGLEPALFGKWLDALRSGQLVSENLLAAPRSTLPPVLGLVVHYGIGSSLAAAFVFTLCRAPAVSSRPLVAGILFGIATSVFAWFLMFPSMGFGLFGLRPPEGINLLYGSLLRHAAYGLGLGLVAHFWLVRRLSDCG
jgi:hypothetical protein